MVAYLGIFEMLLQKVLLYFFMEIIKYMSLIIAMCLIH